MEQLSVSCSEPFDFKLASRMTFGAGSARRLPELLSAHGRVSTAILVDAGVASTPAYAEIKDLLVSAGLLNFEHVTSIVEPTFDEVDSIVDQYRAKAIDSLVVFGGGSSIDIAKGISILLTNPGKAIEYRGYGLVKNPGLPLFVLPTTAGSGSEVTPNASYFDPSAMKKLGINSEHYLPRHVILDPILTVSCPEKATASAGLDALVHTLESFTARASTPLARIFAREAFRLLFNSLGAVLSNPANLPARGRMLLGAYYAGVALMNSASGPAGVLSYPLGVRYKVPHGFAGAVFLAPVIQFNIEHGYMGYAELFDLIEPTTETKLTTTELTTGEKNQAFLEAVRGLCQSSGAPTSLTALGVKGNSLRPLAEEAFVNRTKSAQQNPIAVDIDALETIMRLAL